MRFTFDQIYLPDSNVNEAASHGFLKFRVHQMPGNTAGTRIENTGFIYFDFNSAVVTNTVFHTVSKPGIVVVTPPSQPAQVTASPNPSSDRIRFCAAAGAGVFSVEVVDMKGVTVARLQGNAGNIVELEVKDMPAGIYVCRYVTGNHWAGTVRISVIH
jgi:hypothetical protein